MALVGVAAACGNNGAGRSAGHAPATVSAPDQDMIVILRDQRTDIPAVRPTRSLRAAVLASSQLPLISELQQARARAVHSFGLINAFSTRLSQEEAARLSSHPLVQVVVPDMALRLPKLYTDGAGRPARPVAGTVGSSASSLCNTLEPEALQLTNTAFNDPTIPQAQEVIDGNGRKVTGRGVKVAFIADGVDPTNPGFIRPDGTSVFADYQDFSGDPEGTPTDGAEAFGDASSIAAQDTLNGRPLTFDISQFVSAAHPLPSPCNIRVRGMAPGASLVGLKVFSNLGYTSTSGFVQAIEYAVITDGVDVVNESFGGNPFPDFAHDPISMANQAAVNAGVTVTVSSGDAGTAGTLGSPATDPSFIMAGASTQFRLYAQTGYGFMALATNNGYLSDNISSLSSGGFAQKNPRTVDVVAPGDLGWALCSTNQALFSGCGNYSGAPSSILVFGGTSEAAPLTAGAAALVIQAYRSTHEGQDPSPALIKKIIMSTADDLGAPSDEQGAGRIDGLAAVQMALSVSNDNAPRGTGKGLLASPSSARVTAQVGQGQQTTFEVTNTGSVTEYLSPALETLGAPIAGQTLTLQLAPATDPTFPNVVGDPRPYIKQTFTVPAGADHLDAAIAIPSKVGGNQTIASLVLLDPSGRHAAYSLPQGIGSGYGHVDVVKPAAGKWTALIDTTPAGVSDSYTGAVQFTWSAERYVALGSVYPSHLVLPPGSSASVTAVFDAPAQPGDLAAAVRFHDSATGVATSEIPVTVRTQIPTRRSGGAFTSTLTGGNGRAGASPTQTFEFNVPSGVNDMSLALGITDSGYALVGYLVDPNGMVLSSASNLDANGAPQNTVQLFRASPQPGTWHFILNEQTSSGLKTSILVRGQIGFNVASVTAAGLPTHSQTRLSASAAPVTVPVVVTNTGAVTKAYFADARLDTTTNVTLPTNLCSAAATTPGLCAYAFIPTEASSVQFVAQSTVPLNMDVAWSVGGSPDLYGSQAGNNTVTATALSPEVTYGAWVLFPALVGPYGAAGATPEAVTTSVTASIQAFDSSISASSGDAWADLTLGTNTFNPLVLAPGASGPITVTPHAGSHPGRETGVGRPLHRHVQRVRPVRVGRRGRQPPVRVHGRQVARSNRPLFAPALSWAGSGAAPTQPVKQVDGRSASRRGSRTMLAAPSCRDGRYVDLPHRHHGQEGTLEGERLALLELRAAVETETRDPQDGELHGQNIAFLASRKVTRRRVNREHFTVRERGGIEARRLLGVLVKPQAGRVLRDHGGVLLAPIRWRPAQFRRAQASGRARSRHAQEIRTAMSSPGYRRGISCVLRRSQKSSSAAWYTPRTPTRKYSIWQSGLPTRSTRASFGPTRVTAMPPPRKSRSYSLSV
jgi:hypothetical protein